MIDLTMKEMEENEINDMSVLTSFFDSLSSILPKIEEEKRYVDDRIKESSSQLILQEDSINSVMNELLPSMEYPF